VYLKIVGSELVVGVVDNFGAAAGCLVEYCLWQRYANGFVADAGEIGGLEDGTKYQLLVRKVKKI
jgi:hypothetical protein